MSIKSVVKAFAAAIGNAVRRAMNGVGQAKQGRAGRRKAALSLQTREVGKSMPAATKPTPVESPPASVPAPQTAPVYVDRGPALSPHYGQDRIEATVRDPNGIFVCWELKGPRCEQVRREFGPDALDGAGWVLRLYSDAPGYPQDVSILPEAGNWYLRVPENRSYVIEIGATTRGGGFVSMSMAKEVRTPRDGPSDDRRCEWMLVEEDFRRVVRLAAGQGPVVNGKLAESMAERFRAPVGSSLAAGRAHIRGSHQMGSFSLQRPHAATTVTKEAASAPPASGLASRP